MALWLTLIINTYGHIINCKCEGNTNGHDIIWSYVFWRINSMVGRAFCEYWIMMEIYLIGQI